MACDVKVKAMLINNGVEGGTSKGECVKENM